MTEKEQLISILKEVEPDIDYEKETKLATDHLLTSLDIVRLVMQISEQFDVSISPMDIIPDNFDSVDRMIEMIHRAEMN